MRMRLTRLTQWRFHDQRSKSMRSTPRARHGAWRALLACCFAILASSSSKTANSKSIIHPPDATVRRYPEVRRTAQPFLSPAYAQPPSLPFRQLPPLVLLVVLPTPSWSDLHPLLLAKLRWASASVKHHVPCHHPAQTRLPMRHLHQKARGCDSERRICASWSDPD